MELNMVARREAGGAYPPSSPMVVRGCRLNTRESPARVAGLRGGLVQRAASSLSPNELCELPAGFSSGWLRTAAQAALGRRFGSHQLQFHNTAFSKVPGRLIGFQPDLEDFLANGNPRPKDIGFESKLGPGGIENLAVRRGNS